jgi:phospholipase C
MPDPLACLEATVRRTAIIAALFALGACATAPVVRSVEAGPIWNQDDANVKCPALAQQKGGAWTGQWVTTRPGEMSVCEIKGGKR